MTEGRARTGRREDSPSDRPVGNERRQRGDASAPLPAVQSATSEFREVNGVELHVVAAGDPDDPLVVLLHGYPEFWYGWRDYVGPLVEAGYRVLVPDQRGYNRSEKPDGIEHYGLGELSGDVVGLVDSEGRESAHVVGHDWGASVAWDVALRHPGTVERLGVLNVPHPTVFESTLKSNLTQLRKSWYMFYYQLPRIPLWTNTRNDFASWVDALREAEPGTFTDEDVGRYRTAWNRDGAPRAMLNWYRALFRASEDPPRERAEAPTLVLWGENDPWLVPEMAPRSLEYCEAGHLERFPDATHWINHERRESVTSHLLDFFDGESPG